MLDSLHNELIAMAQADRDAQWEAKSESTASAEPVFRKNSRRLKEIVQAHGYPGLSLVGADGANAAWLIVQHSDFDSEFQETFLQMMELAVQEREASPREFAYLTDRVCVGTGRRQVFGTQCELDGEWRKCRPLVEPDAVDRRRESVGLEPLAQYVCSLTAFNVAWAFGLKNPTITIGDPTAATPVRVQDGDVAYQFEVQWDPVRLCCRVVTPPTAPV